MNEAIKARWVEALRSGKFKQARHKLSIDGGHCCLGVLCELAVEDGVIEKHQPQLGERCARVVSYDGAVSTLPPSVQEWAGVDVADPYVNAGYDGMEHLSAMNDEGASFGVIATLIEESL